MKVDRHTHTLEEIQELEAWFENHKGELPDSLQIDASIYARQAASKILLTSAEGYYNTIRNSNSISERWSLALEMKDIYQTGKFVTDGMNYAAKSNLDYARRLHQSADYSSAINYYDRVINESIVDRLIRNQALVHKIQASSKLTFRTATDYYEDI